jgi:Flp pilus assembly protein TadG
MNDPSARKGLAFLLRAEQGQVLPMTALMLAILIGFAGLVIDIGRVWIAQRQLQNAVDAAAAVAGEDMPNSVTAYNAAVTFSGFNTGPTIGKNKLTGYGVSSASNASPSQWAVTFSCVTNRTGNGSISSCGTDTSGDNCKPPGAQPPQPAGTTTCNAVTVSETATVRTTFAHLFIPNFTVTASATASARGGISHPLDVEIILDTTDSMTDPCTSTVTGIPSGKQEKIDCAKQGVQALLQGLWPCTPTPSQSTPCGPATANPSGELGANVAHPEDEVGLLAFPALSSTNSRPDEIDCKNDNFSVTYPPPPFGNQPGYDIVDLSSDYRPSVANTTLNWTTSNLVEAVDWGQCPGSVYPGGDYYGLKTIGGQGSYLAGAIADAQYILDQAQKSRPGVSSAIIVLSDGEMNQPKGFTDNTPCNSANNSATTAKADPINITIYSIAYDSSGNCTDTSGPYHNVAGLQLMKDIASNANTFFNQPNPGDLTSIFQQVGVDLTDSRLIG